MKRVIVLSIAMSLFGCGVNDELPLGLNDAKRPLTIRALGKQGVLIEADDGKLYSFSEGYYFAQTIMASELKVGDIIAGKPE